MYNRQLVSGGRLEERDQAHDIVDEDEEKQRPNKGDIFLTSRPEDAAEKVIQAFQAQLNEILEFPGCSDRRVFQCFPDDQDH